MNGQWIDLFIIFGACFATLLFTAPVCYRLGRIVERRALNDWRRDNFKLFAPKPQRGRVYQFPGKSI